jgi:hypothetical protein
MPVVVDLDDQASKTESNILIAGLVHDTPSSDYCHGALANPPKAGAPPKSEQTKKSKGACSRSGSFLLDS